MRGLSINTYKVKQIVMDKFLSAREEQMFTYSEHEASNITGVTFDELTAERLAPQGRARKLVWVKKSTTRANEAFDCVCYAYVGMLHANPSFVQRAPRSVDTDALARRMEKFDETGELDEYRAPPTEEELKQKQEVIVDDRPVNMFKNLKVGAL